MFIHVILAGGEVSTSQNRSRSTSSSHGLVFDCDAAVPMLVGSSRRKGRPEWLSGVAMHAGPRHQHMPFASVSSTSVLSPTAPSSVVQQSSLQLWIQDQLAKVPIFKPLVMQARQAMQEASESASSSSAAAAGSVSLDARGGEGKKQAGSKPNRLPTISQSERPLWEMFKVQH